MPRSKPSVLAVMSAAAIIVAACDSDVSTPKWRPDPPLAAARIADDPYLKLPPHSQDHAVKHALEYTVTAAFARSDFTLLEAMTKYYRDTGARTPAGTWKLSIFYETLASDKDAGHPKEDASFSSAEKKDRDWIAAFPKSPTPYIAYGEQLTSHGWFFRGTGFAKTVTIGAFENFHEYLAFADSVLEKNKNVATSDPEWYAAMATMALGQDWRKDQFEPLLKEGIDRFPFYYGIYFNGARHYLPIWGGNVDDLDSFVKYAVAKTRSKEGTTLYARIYAGHMSSFYYLFKESRVQWPLLFNALQGMRQLYPDPRNDNRFALLACMAGDKKWTARMMPLIQDAPDMDFWVTRDYFNRCRTFALSTAPQTIPKKQPGGGNFSFSISI